MTGDPTPTAPVAAATAALEAAADALRNRVDLVGKTLAAIATLGTGAVGLAKVSDLAPLRTGSDWAIAVVAILFLLLAAHQAVSVAIRLLQVGDPIVLGPEADVSVLQPVERADVERVFGLSAARFGFTSLAALQERERGLRKTAARSATDDERARRTALADEIRLEIDYAVARARTTVVRRRSTEAVSGSQSRTAFFLVAVGLVGFALFSDVVASQDDTVATAKACAEAREAGAEAADLDGTPCSRPADGDDAAASESDRSPEQVRIDLAAELMAVLTTCLAEEDALADDCAEVRTTLVGLLDD
ncbi:hypothetical protein [Nocardioides sp. 1609]|uniref:hypothetical protein n=1 Tax=Nocardioides sp. 1609 TaxID=2508327 RepID=UPI00106F0E1E|nr:hypothetical protein [Nocardioides sp. 1609]